MQRLLANSYKLCHSRASAPGHCAGREYTRDYEGLVDLSQAMVKGRDARGQQLAVLSVLRSLMPEQAAVRFRKWFPLSQARWRCLPNSLL